MPLLMCPNDNASMLKITREGVEIDICPTCRGVWLDRGELEKLLEKQKVEADAAQAEQAKFRSEVDAFRQNPEDWRQRHPYDAERKRYKGWDDDDDDHHRRGRKKRGFDIFDIFD